MSETPTAPGERQVQQRTLSTGIGTRVSERRRQMGLRVADLAGVVGVSSSLISQIERGRTSPSIATLFKLAKALSVPIDDLFEEPGSDQHLPSAVEVVTGGPTSESAEHATGSSSSDASIGRDRYLVRRNHRAILDIKGGVQWERLTPTTFGDIEFLELVYGPRAESDPQLYRHPGWEMLVVLSGRLDIYVGFERYDLGPGDSLCFPSSRPHRYVNPTDTTARAISAILPDATFADTLPHDRNTP
jgi:transcriptional regulator with XRE-family HTH domain